MNGPMQSVTAFAPATVSNVACGFDVLGFALQDPGDEVTARLIAGDGVCIDDILGDSGRLPRDPAKNTASVAAQALLAILGERRGLALTIRKGLPLSSGLGGSAASAVAAVVVHPDLEIETARARALLGTHVPLADAIRQWANLGALVDALHRADFALLARALEDTIAEPRRAALIPGLAAIKQAATGAGALGCSLSGSGPSLFALCRDRTTAQAVATAMSAAVRRHIGGEPQTYVSPIAPHGARVVSTCAS